jgi:hypothetical protein
MKRIRLEFITPIGTVLLEYTAVLADKQEMEIGKTIS